MFYLNLFLTIGLISCCVSLVCIVINVLCCYNTPKIIEKIGSVVIPISLFFLIMIICFIVVVSLISIWTN
ncbi:hypothetical protein AB9_157 [Acinetobacter phage vB_AbaM_B9]|nr:hypothetical protein AB9_001 [Acinetobacter phage vB_AbaM_B9]AWD93324.1 hypothetical protein AB9_157 [Acinetobacter phage vB_AbaM_B9]